MRGEIGKEQTGEEWMREETQESRERQAETQMQATEKAGMEPQDGRGKPRQGVCEWKGGRGGG